MTVRGKLTLAAPLLLLVLFLLLQGRGATPAPEAQIEPAPEVSAGPEAEVSAEPTPPVPPVPARTRWAEPPVAREALASLEEDAAGGLTLDPDLTRKVWQVLDRGRVALGHVLVMDPLTGELLAYVSTDPQAFPPDRTYPAASLVKIVTAAALLDASPSAAARPCRYAGNPYRLNRRGVDPPARGGNQMSLRRAISTSNNKCFAQYAVHRLGGARLLDALDRFGLLRPAAPLYPAGAVVDPGEDPLQLGKLGSGLDGLRITPLHAIQLAGVLAHGRRVEPTWVVERDAADLRQNGPSGDRVLTDGLTRDLREMLVDTTLRGTARKAFRTRRGRPLLRGIPVAGKTGSLNGRNPDGRYEWFIGVAPADAPTIAVATVAVQGPLYWMSASQLAAEVLKVAFCPKGVCSSEPPQARRIRVDQEKVGG